MNTIKLVKNNNCYTWMMDGQKSEGMSRASARAFGVWWLRIKRDHVDIAVELMLKANDTAIFSADGSFLYIESHTSNKT